MRKYFFLLLCVVSSSLLSAQQQTNDKAIKVLYNGKYKQFLKLCNDEVRSMVNVQELDRLMKSLNERIGKWQSWQKLDGVEKEGLWVSRYLAKFEKDSLVLVLSASGKKIAGIGFTPGATSIPYSKPVYGNGFPYSNLEIEVGFPGLELKGELMWPARQETEKLPLVILVHGSGPNDMDQTIGPNKVFLDIALGLCKNRIASMRYNKRSFQHPQSFAGKAFTLEDEVSADLFRMLDFAYSLPWVDTQAIYVLGHSQGAIMAPSFLMRDKRLAGIIMACGTHLPLSQVVNYQIGYLDTVGGKPGDPRTRELQGKVDSFRNLTWVQQQNPSLVFMGSPMSWWRDIDTVFDERAFMLPGKRKLVINAAQDYQVPPFTYSELHKKCTNSADCKAVEYPELNHLMMRGGLRQPAEYSKPGQHVDYQFIQDVSNWILQR
jgi:uncharacterized protein